MTPNEALKKYFGHEEFRPAQLEIINSITEGNSTLAVLPTGGGKSLCYQIPALMANNFSVIISPLIALMKDQVDSLNRNGEIAAFINSTIGFQEIERIFSNVQSGLIKLLYLAPERLENSQFVERIKNYNPSYLFVDEAHCISEWGHNFRPSYRKIREFADYISINSISAFTATATPEVIQDISTQLGMKNPKIFIKGFERDNLVLGVIKTKKKKIECFDLISNYKTPAIIYTSSRKKCEEIAEFLNLYSLNAAFYHAGLASEARKHVQEMFIKDKINIIVATNAFGMGIDKKDIRLVIHYNMPGSIENYYQEVGRAGRDGKESHAFLLYDDSDKLIHNYFISNSYPDKAMITGVYNALCDYGKVALGHLSSRDIPVNYTYISTYLRKEVSKSLINASINALEQAGYIKTISGYEKRYYAQFNLDAKHLKEYTKTISNDTIRDIIVILLREYTSNIINSKTQIYPEKLAETYDISPAYLFDTLDLLDTIGIIDYTKPPLENSVSVSKTRVKDEYLYLDYKKILENYHRAIQKLDRMIEYSYSGECRIKFIVDYFGETVTDYKCGKCDNCTQITSLTPSIMDYLSELVLRAVRDNESGLYENKLISILQGKSETALLDSSPLFGCCSSYSIGEIKIVIDLLCSNGLLIKEGRQKKKIFISPEGKNILGKTEPSPVVRKEIPPAFYEDDLELFNRLRQIRSEAAAKFQQTSNLICPDETLRMVTELKPTTHSAITSIKGFNQRMFNKLGNEFLEVINEFVNSNKEKDNGSNKALPANIRETYKLLTDHYSLKDIASLRKLNEAVISLQIETILEMFPETDIAYLFSETTYQMIEEEIKNGVEDLKILKTRMPEEVSYALLRIAVAKFKNRMRK
ncbi:MAG: RecQ family ATP-dependent DNA helicase [Ignavibacteriales bacterium]